MVLYKCSILLHVWYGCFGLVGCLLCKMQGLRVQAFHEMILCMNFSMGIDCLVSVKWRLVVRCWCHARRYYDI